MKELLYVGKFLSWNDKNEDELFDALKIFDKVTICVMFNRNQQEYKKGQPTKIIDETVKHRIKIRSFKNMKKLLNEKKDCKYILFER